MSYVLIYAAFACCIKHLARPVGSGPRSHTFLLHDVIEEGARAAARPAGSDHAAAVLRQRMSSPAVAVSAESSCAGGDSGWDGIVIAGSMAGRGWLPSRLPSWPLTMV